MRGIAVEMEDFEVMGELVTCSSIGANLKEAAVEGVTEKESSVDAHNNEEKFNLGERIALTALAARGAATAMTGGLLVGAARNQKEEQSQIVTENGSGGRKGRGRGRQVGRRAVQTSALAKQRAAAEHGNEPPVDLPSSPPAGRVKGGGESTPCSPRLKHPHPPARHLASRRPHSSTA